jgi:adenylate cyclase
MDSQKTLSPSEKRLFALIEERLQPGADIRAIDAKIEGLFSEDWAVLITDMSGFSRRTARYGIIHFLTMIHTLRQLAEPLLHEHDGLLLKVVADSFFVIFRSPASALSFCLALRQATAGYNQNKTVDEQIHVCQGLGFGRILRIGDSDVFGHEVNLAARLGEDVAHAGEILLTERAKQELTQTPGVSFESREGELFGAGPVPYFLLKNS